MTFASAMEWVLQGAIARRPGWESSGCFIAINDGYLDIRIYHGPRRSPSLSVDAVLADDWEIEIGSDKAHTMAIADATESLGPPVAPV